MFIGSIHDQGRALPCAILDESCEQRRALGLVIGRLCAQIPPEKIARLSPLHGKQYIFLRRSANGHASQMLDALLTRVRRLLHSDGIGYMPHERDSELVGFINDREV